MSPTAMSGPAACPYTTSHQQYCQPYCTQPTPSAPSPHWALQAYVSTLLLLRVLLPCTFILLYALNPPFFQIANYWTTRFFNHALFRRPTEAPLILRPPISNTISPYWMTIHALRETLHPSPLLFFIWASALGFVVRVVPPAWIDYIFLCVVQRPLRYALPLGIAVWFAREIVATLRAIAHLTGKTALNIVRALWASQKARLWILPVTLTAWVVMTSPLEAVVRDAWAGMVTFVAEAFFKIGDGVRDMAGTGSIPLEPEVRVRDGCIAMLR
ncbi:hypothetical protein B0T14DRAFT_232800 [Immersiella caudata]|uniref:Uncharacterized protein n=1 Tax=Immersiella caudata TaxID=314043 RepID=A0AA39WRX7_9PEZI|nr:hypothetical protein B0T14DRAFT_232800 [Immersiella caudata]